MTVTMGKEGAGLMARLEELGTLAIEAEGSAGRGGE